MNKIVSRATRRASQSVTIQTVADLAGVSAMTVSNVLNDRRNVRAVTREAVIEAARQLGYTPNLAARSLASAATVRIGLFSRDLDSGFLSSILSGALEETSERGVQLVMLNDETDYLRNASQYLIETLEGRYDPHTPIFDLERMRRNPPR